MENPLLSAFTTPFGVPPFDLIKESHYLPAFREAIRQHSEEIDRICQNPAPANFSNTIEAFDYSGRALDQVAAVFFNQLGTSTNEEMQRISNEMAPELSRHQDSIFLNSQLFERIKDVWESEACESLQPEQNRLVNETYKDFVQGGANLSAEDKESLGRINEELSLLTLTFGENVLAETNDFKLILETGADLEGLPDSVRSGAASAAREEGLEGKWLFTLHKPSFIPFMQYSLCRDLREKLFGAYINRSNRNNAHDNKELINKIITLRIKRSHLLGYRTFADYSLEDNMAKNPANVEALLKQVWAAAIPAAKKETTDLKDMALRMDGLQELKPWDWWFYSEKLRKERYDLDDEMLRPYFRLETVIEGAFKVASELYELKIKELQNIPLPYPEARCYEICDPDNSHLGILYMDFYPRASKESGAWMSNFREQWRVSSTKVTPVVTNVFNFTKPTPERPSLLNFDEVTTLFHEFGHGLHSLLSDCTYKSLSGTNVPRDFVELPSQFMENWAFEPQILRMFARHYETGEVIPDHLIEKIRVSRHFNQGFATVEYLSAALLDLAYHSLSEETTINPPAFEAETMRKIGMLPEIVTRYRSTFFNHIFSGGYSAGYYSYIWSEVLDADAFEAFRETGLFDKKTAKSFRDNILSKGNIEDPRNLFKRFRGREPEIAPLLRKRGLIPDPTI
ncbi:MAG TPA: peptidase M3 [Bacteroidales bacterium]|nr:peptidase M3 [Bacteroidales bacterium]